MFSARFRVAAEGSQDLWRSGRDPSTGRRGLGAQVTRDSRMGEINTWIFPWLPPHRDKTWSIYHLFDFCFDQLFTLLTLAFWPHCRRFGYDKSTLEKIGTVLNNVVLYVVVWDKLTLPCFVWLPVVFPVILVNWWQTLNSFWTNINFFW